jgi:iron complex transport system substrate-binding protein
VAEIPEILYHLGALDRVVGISAYTTRPLEALNIEKVTGFQHGNIKRIMKNNPQLAILTSGVQQKLANDLAQEGVSMLHLNPHRLEDMFDSITLIGNLVGEAERAKQLNSRLREEVEEVRTLASRLPRRPRVYFEEWMDPFICGTGWVSDLIEIAGGQDVFRQRSIEGRRAAERIVSPEQVIDAAPEIILASWCGKPFRPEELMNRPHFSDVPAVQAGAVYEIKSEILQCGPMLMDSLRELHTIIKNFVN